MTKLDWENITNYIDSVGTTDTVFPFIKAQSSVKVTASGARDNIIYTIGGQSGTLLPGQSVTVTGAISSMTLRSASGRQPFHVWATEAGTEKDQTDTSYQGQIDGLTTQLAQKANLSDLASVSVNDCFVPGNRFYRSMYAYANKLTDSNIISNNVIDKTPFEINIFGDSIPGFMAYPLVQFLAANKKINGLGFSNFATYGQTFGNPFEKCVRTGFAITQDDATNAENWGICGRCSKGSGTDTISYQTLEPFTHTDLALFYCKKSGGGIFSYSIDGGAPVQVDTSNATTALGIIEINGLDEKCHKVDIAVVSGSVTLYGIRTWKKNKNGVLLNMMNEGGTTTKQWSQQMGMLSSYLNSYPANQLHIWIGANDLGIDNATPDQFNGYLQTILTTYPVGTMTDVILYTHYERGTDADISLPNTSFNTTMALYDSDIRNLVLQYGYSLFDVSKIFPSRTIGYNAGMFADAIHPSTKGASFVSMIIADRCLPRLPSDAFVNKRTFENTSKIPLFLAGKRNILEYIPNPAVGATRRCGVLAQNGKIYAIARGSNDILCIDPNTNKAEVSYFDSTWGAGSLHDGLVAAPNGLIYIIPSRDTKVMTVDPVYNTVNTAITGLTIVSSADNWSGGVLTPEGKIYCPPANASQKNILVIDTIKNTVSYIDTTSLALATTIFRSGVYAPNGKIYFANSAGTDVLVVDTSNNTTYKLTSASGSTAFFGGVVGQNGKLYFIPAYAGQVMVIDPSNDTITYIAGTDSANRPSYQGGVLAPDGKIYCPPYNSTKMLVIDPIAGTKDEATYTGFTANGASYSGAVLAPNGKIYCIPENSTQIMVINPGFPTVAINPLLSPMYNKSW